MTLTRSKPLSRSRKKAKPTKRTTERRKADALWSLKVRERGECELRRYHAARTDELDYDKRPNFECSGPLQAQHGFSRRYLGTRYILLNGFCGCTASHRWYQTHPIEWTALMIDALGAPVYEELRKTALNFTGPLDYRLIADALR